MASNSDVFMMCVILKTAPRFSTSLVKSIKMPNEAKLMKLFQKKIQKMSDVRLAVIQLTITNNFAVYSYIQFTPSTYFYFVFVLSPNSVENRFDKFQSI